MAVVSFSSNHLQDRITTLPITICGWIVANAFVEQRSESVVSFATPESMPDVRQTVAALDALSARQSETTEPPDPDLLKFVGLDFRGEVMLPIVEERAEVPPWWDREQSRVSLLMANFQGGSLRSANLTGVHFEQANFAGADLADSLLQGAFLGGANFDRALLEETDLSGAYLRFSTFREGVLEGANLRGADLWGAKLPEVDADKADFREAQLEEADFRMRTRARLIFETRSSV